MKTNKKILLPALFIAVMLYSCSPKNISTKYYYQNEKVLDSIEETYKEINSSTPFDVGFTSKDFTIVSLGILTDSLKYIYEFKVGDNRLADTLKKFGLPVKPVIELVKQMQSIRCTWISSYDYYTDEKKQELIFMSIKPVALNAPLSYKKYYILTYFQQPQYFDNDGLLLERRKLKRLRKINGEIFKRINDKVCYTVSTTYR
ncbi:MAG: hypothetical protein KF825_03075 [Ferruginibacter sp.]|nr:hypothetical protein [Ferruginibacter sp.]